MATTYISKIQALGSNTEYVIKDAEARTDLALKAPLASPALTGIPTAPTATSGTNTTQIATTAFVTTAISGISYPVTSVNGQTGAVTLTIPDAQVNADWNATSGVAQILNKPTITDNKVTQTQNTSNNEYPVLLKNTTGTSSTTDGVKFASGITVTPGTGNLKATKFNNYILAAACAKGVDTSISDGTSSTNLPTSAAVASYVSTAVSNATITVTNTLSSGTVIATVSGVDIKVPIYDGSYT